jgi:hypothetical protein
MSFQKNTNVTYQTIKYFQHKIARQPFNFGVIRNVSISTVSVEHKRHKQSMIYSSDTNRFNDGHNSQNVPQSCHFGTKDFTVCCRTANFITEVYIHLYSRYQCQRGHASRGVLTTVARRVRSRNLENEEAEARYRAVKIQPKWVVTAGKQTNIHLYHNVVFNTRIIRTK